MRRIITSNYTLRGHRGTEGPITSKAGKNNFYLIEISYRIIICNW